MKPRGTRRVDVCSASTLLFRINTRFYQEGLVLHSTLTGRFSPTFNPHRFLSCTGRFSPTFNPHRFLSCTGRFSPTFNPHRFLSCTGRFSPTFNLDSSLAILGGQVTSSLVSSSDLLTSNPGRPYENIQLWSSSDQLNSNPGRPSDQLTCVF
ncbi:hypothetical protein LR48_Vigan10g060300 [Vigna angularis]|uniref:Uncharacterized protein n=1 Tax=Phaseolus angularis TaxID=3914 RepID=A0A0L9VI28_PHAAN|nr:hypothetical protein LR48_Vigan10g060300 [Vigna angularis]